MVHFEKKEDFPTSRKVHWLWGNKKKQMVLTPIKLKLATWLYTVFSVSQECLWILVSCCFLLLSQWQVAWQLWQCHRRTGWPAEWPAGCLTGRGCAPPPSGTLRGAGWHWKWADTGTLAQSLRTASVRGERRDDGDLIRGWHDNVHK